MLNPEPGDWVRPTGTTKTGRDQELSSRSNGQDEYLSKFHVEKPTFKGEIWFITLENIILQRPGLLVFDVVYKIIPQSFIIPDNPPGVI